jgi:hypothetical protein
MSRRLPLIIAGVLAVVVVAVIIVFAATPQGEAGMGIPTEDLVDPPAAEPQAIGGTMHIEANGCFDLRTADGDLFLIWPEGYRHDATAAVAPDGTRVAGGDDIAGTGWLRTGADVVAAADGPDGYMDMVIDYCAGDAEQVVVLQSIG